MAGSNINVSYAEMTQASSKLNSKKDAIRSELDAARGLIRSLVSDGFVTQHASGTFDLAAEKFVTGAKELMTGLEELGAYLNRTADVLQRVDQELASRISTD